MPFGPPTATAVLRDAIIEAAESSQSIVTTQSADLLDTKDVPSEYLLAALFQDGVTRIGPLGEGRRTIISEHLSIALDRDPPVYIEAFVSKRVGREKLVNEGGIESAVEQAALDGGPDAAIPVLLGADDDCPAILGPTLLDRARKARPDRQVSVVLAKRKYEA